jgi:hypothetical protein
MKAVCTRRLTLLLAFPRGSPTADKANDVDPGLCSSSTYSYMPSILSKSSESRATTLIKSGALSPELHRV